MNMMTILSLLLHPKSILQKIQTSGKIAVKAILGLCVAFVFLFGINTCNKNKELSESLEMALNNIEAYLDALNGSLLAFGVLKLDMEALSELNDELIHKIDSVRKENKIKASNIHTAATQTLTINVNESKGVRGDLITILKDSTYKDTILFNDLTTVSYTVGKDTVNIALDIHNTQYLYTIAKKEYKNKKNFFKRLFTLDFKKVTRYKYLIINTNDLIQTDSVRIIESK